MKSVSCKTVFQMGQCYMRNCTSLPILLCLQCSTICSAHRFGYNNCTTRCHFASGTWESETVQYLSWYFCCHTLGGGCVRAGAQGGPVRSPQPNHTKAFTGAEHMCLIVSGIHVCAL
jgi:hypothetical protein